MNNSLACASCRHTEIRAEAKFCSECGKPFPQPNPPIGNDLQSVIPKFSMPDNWHDGLVVRGVPHSTRPELADKTMLELIRSGMRTALTRQDNAFFQIETGDVIRLTCRKDNVTIRVVEPPYRSTRVTAQEWSRLEGLEQSLYEKVYGQPGYSQLRFSLLNPNPTNPQGQQVAVAAAKSVAANKTRRFRLPNKTTFEQDFALDLPEDGLHLLIGGPGTGKSVIALLRASRLAKKNRPHAFLAYNQLLVHVSKSLDRNTPKDHKTLISAGTWKSWFRATWMAQMGTPCPDLGEPYLIDWPSIRLQLNAKATIPAPKESHLVIDEGQDMPGEFYEALSDMGFENIYVVADFNQVLTLGENCNYPDLCRVLLKDPKRRLAAGTDTKTGVPENQVVQLTANHRNSYPVARLAATFYTGDPQSPPPDLPPTSRTAKVPQLIAYEEGSHRDFTWIVRRILLTAEQDLTKLIGVLCHNNAVRLHYENALRAANGGIRIDSWDKNKDARQLPDFTTGGIILLNAQACKGLEFDQVIIADVDQFLYRESSEKQQKMLFYVMVSRAKERVIMIQNRANPCPISAILPIDPNILARN